MDAGVSPAGGLVSVNCSATNSDQPTMSGVGKIGFAGKVPFTFTFYAAGTQTISCISYDASGNASPTATNTLTVSAAPTVPQLSALALSCPTTLTAGTSGACAATASYSDGSSKTVKPSSWTSSRPDILTVTDGQLNAISATSGVSKVCASYSENASTQSQCADVTVNTPPSLLLPTPLTVVAGDNLSVAPISGKAVYCYTNPDTLTASLDKNSGVITLSAASTASGKALLTCVDSGGISSKADVTLYPDGTLEIPSIPAMETGDSRDITVIGTPVACAAATPGIISATPRQNGLTLKALKPGKTDISCGNARSKSVVVTVTVNAKHLIQDAKLALAGALVNGVARMENPLVLTARDNASLQLALNVSAEHQGKAVEPILVASLGKATFVARKSDGNWIGWGTAPATLPAAGKKLLAGNQLTFNDIYEGSLPVGEYTIFAGYRYDDGSGIVPIVANLSAPLRIIVNP